MWQFAAMAGYQVISGLHQAEMVGMQASIQKEIDDFNVSLAKYDAWKVQAYGQSQMAKYQTQLDQAEANARTSAAAEGVNIREGSLSEVVDQNKLVGTFNMMDIENQAREKALGYERQASSMSLGSKLNQMQSKTLQASIIGGSIAKAAGSLLQGSISETSPKAKGSESGYSVTGLNGSQSLTMPTQTAQPLSSYLGNYSFTP